MFSYKVTVRQNCTYTPDKCHEFVDIHSLTKRIIEYKTYNWKLINSTKNTSIENDVATLVTEFFIEFSYLWEEEYLIEILNTIKEILGKDMIILKYEKS